MEDSTKGSRIELDALSSTRGGDCDTCGIRGPNPSIGSISGGGGGGCVPCVNPDPGGINHCPAFPPSAKPKLCPFKSGVAGGVGCGVGFGVGFTTTSLGGDGDGDGNMGGGCGACCRGSDAGRG